MKSTLLQGISIVGLMGAIMGPEMAMAQLKPAIDPQIQSYARATGCRVALPWRDRRR